MLDMAFEEEGFCVVRGPDLLWGGDIKRFHPPAGKFDGVIGGPPCQAHSMLVHIVRAVHGEEAVAEDLIPEFERCVAETAPRWFVMENVPAAPKPQPEGGYGVWSEMLSDHWVGGATSRMRRFSFGTQFGSTARVRLGIETLALHEIQPMKAVTCDSREVPVAIGGSGYRKATASGGTTSSLNRGGPLPHQAGRSLKPEEMAARQGLPDGFVQRLRDANALTVSGIRQGIGNGVPLPMGRAVARAVKAAMYPELSLTHR